MQDLNRAVSLGDQAHRQQHPRPLGSLRPGLAGWILSPDPAASAAECAHLETHLDQGPFDARRGLGPNNLSCVCILGICILAEHALRVQGQPGHNTLRCPKLTDIQSYAFKLMRICKVPRQPKCIPTELAACTAQASSCALAQIILLNNTQKPDERWKFLVSMIHTLWKAAAKRCSSTVQVTEGQC